MPREDSSPHAVSNSWGVRLWRSSTSTTPSPTDTGVLGMMDRQWTSSPSRAESFSKLHPAATEMSTFPPRASFTGVSTSSIR